MTEPTIFIVYHKPCELFNLPKNYKKIQAGTDCKYIRCSCSDDIIEKKSNNNEFFKNMDFYDNNGKNISAENYNTSLLSIYYYIYHNLMFGDDEYIGFCHYRRLIFTPPDYKKYDILINSYIDLEICKNISVEKYFCNREIVINDSIFRNHFKTNFPKEYEEFNIFQKELIQNLLLGEIFVMKWYLFKQFFEQLYKIHSKLYIYREYCTSYAHNFELIVSFVIWKLCKNNKYINNFKCLIF
jgi:hypothetical protein